MCFVGERNISSRKNRDDKTNERTKRERERERERERKRGGVTVRLGLNSELIIRCNMEIGIYTLHSSINYLSIQPL